METISSLVATFIINAMWQILVLFVAAFICSRLLRPAAARYRHLLWTTALVLSAALPVLSLFSLSGKDFKFVLPISFENTQSVISGGGETDKQPETGNQNSMQKVAPSGNLNASIFLLAASACYFSFLAYRLVNLRIMWRQTGRLRRTVKNQPLPPLIKSIAEKCCAALELKPVPICFSAETGTPFTLGARKPLIILPDSFMTISSEEILTAALGHELAHIRRRDYALNCVFELLSTLVSFHPAIKIIKREINQTRELACDELVTETLLKPLDYARSLIQIAGFASPVNQNSYTLGVFNADILEKRIMKLIETNRNANKVFGKMRILFAALLLGVTTLTASVFSFDLPGKKTPATSETEQNAATAKTDDIVPVQILSRPRPTYTDEARRNSTAGTVELRVTFLDSGLIGEVIPVTRLSDGLTEKAIEAAKGIKFKPATQNGTPVTTTKHIRYSFSVVETRNPPPH